MRGYLRFQNTSRPQHATPDDLARFGNLKVGADVPN
jgi:hypothetical protein